MSLFTPSQLITFRVVCSVIPTIVAAATILRLYIKGPKKWWWDDFFVTIGVMVMIEQQGVLWALSVFQPPTLPVFYVVVFSSQTQVWFARASILASILRIAPPGFIRLVVTSTCGLFAAFYLVTLAQLVWVCQSRLQFAPNGNPMCDFSLQVPIYQITTAMIADALLIGLSLRIISYLRGNPSLRRRLQLIFMASAITTCVSITNGVLNLMDSGFGVLVAAEMECWVSLLVCNLGVLLRPLFKKPHATTVYTASTLRPATKSGGVEISTFKTTQTFVTDGGTGVYSPTKERIREGSDDTLTQIATVDLALVSPLQVPV